VATRAAGAWWRQPVAWLGVAIFVASIAGCIVMIVLAERNKDEALPTAGNQVLSVPLARSADVATAAAANSAADAIDVNRR
jgi:hypothetical protein